MIPLVIVGGVFFLIGVAMMLGNMKNLARRKRIVDTPTTPIAHAPGGTVVEVKGRIFPSEQGVLVAPFSGRQVVYARLLIEEYRSSGKSGRWVTVFNQAQWREFMIDDGSGHFARVKIDGANVVLDRQKVATSGTFNDAPPHLEQFLRTYGLSSTSWLGFNKSMRYEEELLVPGDPIYVLGPSQRMAGSPVNDGYRMLPSSVLVMFAAQGPTGELIVTNKSEEELVAKMRSGFLWGVGCAALGALLGIVGVVSTAAAFLLT